MTANYKKNAKGTVKGSKDLMNITKNTVKGALMKLKMAGFLWIAAALHHCHPPLSPGFSGFCCFFVGWRFLSSDKVLFTLTVCNCDGVDGTLMFVDIYCELVLNPSVGNTADSVADNHRAWDSFTRTIIVTVFESGTFDLFYRYV